MIQSCIALCCLEQLLSSHKGHPRICHITQIKGGLMVGREREQHELLAAYDEDEAQLIAV